MADLNQTDLTVRLQLSGQKYSEMLSTYTDSLRYGRKDVLLLQSKLALLNRYIKILLDYTICGCGIDCTNNCITEDEAQSVCDSISKVTGLCFQPIGFKYIGSTSISQGIGFMEIECSFIVG